MSLQILNVLSYVMGLALMFQIGFFVGGYMQRRAIMNAFGNGLQRVETLFCNVFKRGKNENAQADSDDNPPCYGHDSVDVVKIEEWEKTGEYQTYRFHRKGEGLGSGAGEDYQGTGEQGREGFGGETGRGETIRQECDRDSAGAAA